MTTQLNVVVVPTKVIKFLLITTLHRAVRTLTSCCCTYKGNQIFANHNRARAGAFH